MVKTQCLVFFFSCNCRCLLGTLSGPAQFPDANRYMEALIKRLCSAYPGPVKIPGTKKSLTRWTLILRAYKNIRDHLLSNATITSNTGLQLVTINQTTLTTWLNKHQKKQELITLRQGIAQQYQVPAMTTNRSFPAALTEPATTPPVSPEKRHQFVLPPSTIGQCTKFRRRHTGMLLPQPSATAPNPDSHPSTYTTHTLPGGFTILNMQLPTNQQSSIITMPSYQQYCGPPPNMPRSTFYYRKRKEKEAAVAKTDFEEKEYVPRKPASMTICGKCKKLRDATHKQYIGYVYCPTTEMLTFEEWRASKVEDRKQKKLRQT